MIILEAAEFADALLHGRPVSIPPNDGVANVRVIDAPYHSAAAHGHREIVYTHCEGETCRSGEINGREDGRSGHRSMRVPGMVLVLVIQ